MVIGSVERFADRVPQPLNLAGWEPPGTTPPGVLLHAQALRTVLHGGFIRPAPAWFIWTVVAGAAALGFIRSLSLRWLTMAAVVVLAPAAAAGALRAGWHVGLGVVLLAAVAAAIARTAIDSWWHRRERVRLTRMFRGYVSPQVLEAMLDGRLAPQEGRTELGFLFADLRGFSAMSESLPPADVLRLLNRYYAAVTPVIHAHGGTIDNFRGDGVMAIFGAPRPAVNPAADAIGAALAVHAAVDRLNAELAAEGKPPVVAGIGVASGPAVVGDLGSDDRKDYSAIGDPVVVAARLQDLAKELGFAVVASMQALDAAGLAAERRGEFEALGEQSLKGHRAVAVAGWKRVNIPHAAA